MNGRLLRTSGSRHVPRCLSFWRGTISQIRHVDVQHCCLAGHFVHRPSCQNIPGARAPGDAAFPAHVPASQGTAPFTTHGPASRTLRRSRLMRQRPKRCITPGFAPTSQRCTDPGSRTSIPTLHCPRLTHLRSRRYVVLDTRSRSTSHTRKNADRPEGKSAFLRLMRPTVDASARWCARRLICPAADASGCTTVQRHRAVCLQTIRRQPAAPAGQASGRHPW